MTNPTATGRAVPSQRRARERVDAILDAAATLLDTGGPAAVTTTAIASTAGTSVGAVYRYFADSQAIMRALAARNVERFWDDLDARPPHGAGREFLAAIMDRYIEFARSEPGFAVLHFGQRLGDDGRDVAHGVARRLEAVMMRGGITTSEELSLDLEIAATMASALMELAFVLDPHGDQRVIDRTIELSLALLTRHAATD